MDNVDFFDRVKNLDMKNILDKEIDPRKWTFRAWFKIAMAVPIWIIFFNILISTFGFFGGGYEINRELEIPSGEERMHNFYPKTYFFLSTTCTLELLEYHDVTSDEKNQVQWVGCDQNNGVLNISTYVHTPSGLKEESPSLESCKHQYVPLKFGSKDHFYCYGGIILNSSMSDEMVQYTIQNDSPFRISMIEDELFKQEVQYMADVTPGVPETAGTFSCCFILPVYFALYLYHNPPEETYWEL
jgi:hypothetical protein